MIGSGKCLGMNIERSEGGDEQKEERKKGKERVSSAAAADVVLPVSRTGVQLRCRTVHRYMQPPRPNTA